MTTALSFTFIQVPFAFDPTNREAVPLSDQPNGSISYNSGYGPVYDLPDTDPLYQTIPRTQDNQVNFIMSSAIQQLQAMGCGLYITPESTEDGLGFEYYVSNSTIYEFELWTRVSGQDNLPPSVDNGWISLSNPAAPTAIKAGVVQFAVDAQSDSTTLVSTAANVTDRARKASAEVITGSWTFTGNTVVNNNRYWQGKNSSGTPVDLIGIDGGNAVEVGSSAHAHEIKNNGSVPLLNHSGSTKDLHAITAWGEAYISSSGALVNGVGIIASGRLSQGVYFIDLESPVANQFQCVKLCAVGSVPVAMSFSFSSTTRLAIYMTVANGQPVDLAFTVSVSNMGA